MNTAMLSMWFPVLTIYLSVTALIIVICLILSGWPPQMSLKKRYGCLIAGAIILAVSINFLMKVGILEY